MLESTKIILRPEYPASIWRLNCQAIQKWDLVVVSEKQLVLAMEFKSQAGKSTGNQR
jgi:hypothetical protein